MHPVAIAGSGLKKGLQHIQKKSLRADRHTSSCPNMPSNVVVMFLRMAGSTFDPAPWMTNLKAWSIVSL